MSVVMLVCVVCKSCGTACGTLGDERNERNGTWDWCIGIYYISHASITCLPRELYFSHANVKSSHYHSHLVHSILKYKNNAAAQLVGVCVCTSHFCSIVASTLATADIRRGLVAIIRNKCHIMTPSNASLFNSLLAK